MACEGVVSAVLVEPLVQGKVTVLPSSDVQIQNAAQHRANSSRFFSCFNCDCVGLAKHLVCIWSGLLFYVYSFFYRI